MPRSERRKEHDRRKREAALLAKVMAEFVLAELLPRSPFLEADDPDSLWYFGQVQDFLVTPEGNVGIRFKDKLLDYDGFRAADANPVVILEKRRNGTWYFFVKVLFRGSLDREWSEKLSDRIKDHGWMRRTGRRLRVWSVTQVQEGFMALLGLGYRF